MKAQRVEMFVIPMAAPSDTSGLQLLADEGKIKPETLVALVGKTEGTGQHDDWGRVWADVALREWTGRFLGIPAGDVAQHVIFVLSGGCPGVITPHIAAITREWVDVPAGGVHPATNDWWWGGPARSRWRRRMSAGWVRSARLRTPPTKRWPTQG